MRFFIGVLIALGLIVLVFVLIFTGGNQPVEPKPKLARAANSSVLMRLTIEGSVQANKTYREIRLTIGRDTSQLQVIQGYQGKVIKSKTYNNNVDSYSVFLSALDRAGYTNGNDDPKQRDERGVCPLGQRYIFETMGGAKDQRYWDASCPGVGTFKGRTALVLTLFQKQIPDYSELTSGVSL